MYDQRILVVEDDPQIAYVLYWNLLVTGYAVTVAGDGLSAMRAFDTGEIALVTVDLMLPLISGFRLVKAFKRARPDIPVVVISSLTFEEAEEVAQSGVNDFLTKPFDPRRFIDMVQYHLSSRLPAPVNPAPRPEPAILVRA